MTQALALRTTLITSFAMLLCSSIVCAQDSAAIDGENRSVVVFDESNLVATSINGLSAEKNVDKSSQATEQLDSSIPQARPGERVTNPDHLILNSDTTLGGVVVNGPNPHDYGYLGPGDMRTHLWNGHSSELIQNGITENKLMAMTVPEVQKWHNHFHGAEGSPEHEHDHDHEHDHEHDEQSHLDTVVQQPTMASSPDFVDGLGYETTVGETIVYDDSGFDSSGYSQAVYGQPEVLYEPGFIVEGYTP